ncbi:BT0820 family HAD-type phosphatase [Ancylomarina longa]|uniref:Hydrolase n=1 Tax=Ancylomarina longa TaxID=2487017 RepID=A0A434ATY0_9BACT|nr:hydrolase [Ancylomarina longa]RUT77890.1 hydrolase [Ancylomarina longa]
MIIAVDFDGTIVKHKYPHIGGEIPFAIESLIALQKEGHQLILWTYRTGELLQEAIEYCRIRGLEFYAVNRNYPEEEFDDTISRKIYADLYIDDRNVGGLMDWGEIYNMISTQELDLRSQPKSKNAISRFFDQLFSD